ncbi:MAG: signal peptidase I [Bacilli bacterium]|nr:signal peptidase I [Bacilli bacterium]
MKKNEQNVSEVVSPEIEKKKKRKHIALEIVEWTGVAICVVFIAFIAVFASKSPSDKTSASLFGYETRLVVSGSMDQSNDSYYDGTGWKVKRIRTGSLIFIKNTQDVTQLSVGDVITFFDPSKGPSVIVTHRIQDITLNLEDLSISEIITHGDNNDIGVTEKITPGNMIGKVVNTSFFLGQLYTKVISNKAVMAVIIIVPCAAIIGLESYKIVKIVKQDKAERAASGQMSSEEQEIYDLEKQIAEIKKKKKSKSKDKEEKK